MASRIEISVRREQPEALSVFHLLFLLCGQYSLLALAACLPALSYPAAWTQAIAGGVCTLLWGAARLKRRWASRVAAACALLWSAVWFLLWDTVRVQLVQAAAALSGAAAGAVPFTESACLFAVLLALSMFLLEIFLESHMIPYILISVATLAAPSFGAPPSMAAVVPGVLFQLSFWAVHEAGLRQGPSDFALQGRSRLTAHVGAVMGGILALSLLAAFPLAARDSDAVYAPVYEAEGALQRLLSHIGGFDAQPASGGVISRGNRYDSGTEHLVLTADRKPLEPIYLRGFSGGDYANGEWARANDEAVFAEMEEAWNGGTLEGDSVSLRVLASNVWPSLYYNLNRQTRRENPPEPLDLLIRQACGEYRTAYTPYYSRWNGGQEGGGYAWRLFEQRDMAVDWSCLSRHINANWYAWVQSAYQEQIQRDYTRVPDLPRLRALCQETPLEGREEITAFILHTLHSRASYSLTPGLTPGNAEIVEYFLFESGLGYCVHFASAATLLYRLYGIPARYAAGYVAWPEDFTPCEDGSFQAVLTDASAHAWTEIFVEDYGWSPVEVTPAAGGGGSAAAAPGLDGERLEALLSELQRTPPVHQEKAPSSGWKALGGSFPALRVRLRKLPRILGTGALCVLLLLAPLAWLLRRRRLCQWKTSSSREVFGRLLNMLRFAGLLDECDGEAADFPARLSHALPAISGEEGARLWRVVQAAAYGPETAAPEEDAFARRLWDRAVRAVRPGLRWWKRPLFRYVYG